MATYLVKLLDTVFYLAATMVPADGIALHSCLILGLRRLLLARIGLEIAGTVRFDAEVTAILVDLHRTLVHASISTPLALVEVGVVFNVIRKLLHYPAILLVPRVSAVRILVTVLDTNVLARVFIIM